MSCFSFFILVAFSINQVRPEHLNQLLHPQFKDDMTSPIYRSNVLTTGLPAAPGAAVGKIVFSPELAGETYVLRCIANNHQLTISFVVFFVIYFHICV